MLLRHSLSYLVARGLPGLVNFASIAVYTRLMEPRDYGRYSLTISTTGFLSVVLFEWLRLSLLRFWPMYRENPQPLLSTIRTVFVLLASLVLVVGLPIAVLWHDQSWRVLVLLGVVLVWCQGWFDLNLELARSNLMPGRYGAMVGLRAVIALVSGVVAVHFGFGAGGPIIGLVIGTGLTTLILGMRHWEFGQFRIDRGVLGEIVTYGIPLSATLALGFVIRASDRFVIARLLGEEAAGLYAASFDFVSQILTMLMMGVGLAFGPLVVRAFEERQGEAVQDVVRRNARLLLVVSMPVIVVFVVLGTEIGAFFLGSAFSEAGDLVIPLAAVGTFLAGLRLYHFDYAFRLGRWTIGQFWLSVPSAILNLVLNVILVPAMGIVGAAVSSVVAYTVALFLTVVFGRRVVKFSFPLADGIRIAIAAILMGKLLKCLRELVPELSVFFAIGVVFLVYYFLLVITGVVRRSVDLELG